MTSTMAADDDELVEDNITRQGEEIEILQSIYGSDFQIEDDFVPTFSIVVHVGEEEGEEATLVVSYHLDYPSSSRPPIYHLSVPWLDEGQRSTICEALNALYLSHFGEPVVYSWVELLREMLLDMRPVKLTVHTNKLIEPLLQAEIVDDDDALANSLETISLHHQHQPKNDKDVGESGRKLQSVPAIFTGEPFTDRKSTFQAHVATIHSVDDVKLILEELYRNKKIAAATHNMYAYRISRETTSSAQTCTIQDCEDDGETHAGSRLLHLLQILDCHNVVVIVSRWYGGIQLHGDRFKHINNIARSALEQQGFIMNKRSTGKKVVQSK